jgi:general secretion pathway protein L
MTDTTTTASRPSAPAAFAAGSAASQFSRWLSALAGRDRGNVPAEPVRLMRAVGSQAVWQGERVVDSIPIREPRFTAVELPDDLLLRVSFEMPPLSPGDSEEALALQARSHSPFAAEDTVWGARVRPAGSGGRAEVVIASRRQARDYTASRWPQLHEGAFEVWAFDASGAPVVVRGFGEGLRLERAQRQRRWDGVLLLVAVLLALAAAVTPTAQLRMRAVEAVESYEALARRAAPLVRKRDEIVQINERLRAVDAAAADRVDPAAVMEHLTRILPDDTYLLTLDIRKSRIAAMGHTSDASALLQRLSADPALKDLRSPTAVTRVPGASKEAFNLEFTLDAAASATLTGTAPAAGPPAGPAAAPSTPMVPAVLGASAAAQVAAPAPELPPPQVAAPATKPAAAASAVGGSPFAIGGSKR